MLVMRVLILAATTGYQTRSFGEAAERLGVELVFATDRCHLIEDPWQDRAIAIRFHDEEASVAAVLAGAAAQPIDGVIAVGDRPTVIAARVAAGLGLPWHPPEAAAVARHKQRTRECLHAASLPVPWFVPISIGDARPASALLNAGEATARRPLSYPCVVKPVALSGSRGVIRADDPASFAAAFARLGVLLRSPEVRAERDEAHETVLVEQYIPGREYAIEALMHHGALQVLAIFDKPEPLDGPFFEETIYITPSSLPDDEQARMIDAVTRAAGAIGLRHGPIHAECRVNGDGVFVLEVAARPIGGLCARSLRFVPTRLGDSGAGLRIPNPESPIPLEELLLRHALGEDPRAWRREEGASGVMMIPIPRRGVYRGAEGVEAARRVSGIDDIRITAKPDQVLVPLPEGASYLGFIFARAASAGAAATSLAAAHARLLFTIDPEVPVLTPAQIHYNRDHG
jgi:hypothetical protein